MTRHLQEATPTVPPSESRNPSELQCLGRNELAKRLRMSTKTLGRRVNDGTIPPPCYIGAKPVWRFSEVNQWLSTLPHEPPRGSAKRQGHALRSE